MFENWRFNPFTEIMNSVLIEDEEHTIEYHEDWNGYGIQLNEGPQLDNPSTVVIVEDVTGGATFTEVPRTQAPGAGQYRVDYAASTYYGTGRVQFNAADNGKKVVVTYYGTGWTVKNNYRQSQLTVPTNMEVEEDATIHGDLTLDGENTGGGNLHVAGDVDIDGGLNVNGAGVIGGTLGVTGKITASGGIEGDLIGDVTGDLTGGVIETGSGAGVVHRKIIAIGDWNMDSTSQVTIAHGLTYSKIKSVSALIYTDSGSSIGDVGINLEGRRVSVLSNTVDCGYITSNSTNIILSRFTDGYFDNANFDSTSYNRGWIVIEYID